ncbi:hypothetical protein A5624_10535 [Mycobacterium sp. 1482292.6]|uniref:hypothetical protein n=1 Tax=unclassified Mycobacterium TaxID=2642494 RepID=UPI0007FFF06A|nr:MULTISPECIES: hypothetical protein [unclassified Mycobacterium]OBJ12678.1 hypothetical protein A5624_10535 [Mycobacterium sp. 1482292.6]OBJ24481.1 hypothetical protein A5622_11765 [Mycobacterium sp. 1245801.1]
MLGPGDNSLNSQAPPDQSEDLSTGAREVFDDIAPDNTEGARHQRPGFGIVNRLDCHDDSVL